MGMAGSKGIPKVMLWAQSGGMGVAFELSMASVDRFKVFHELYLLAAVVGKEKHHSITDQVGENLGFKYKEIKATLEAHYPGYDAVLAMDHTPLSALDKRQYVPEGFQHVFMICDPKKALLSVHECLIEVNEALGLTHENYLDELMRYASISHLKDLYDFVKEKGSCPVVIDSEDLIENPRDVLLKFCNATGVPFRESMLKWKPWNIDHWPRHFRLPKVIAGTWYQAALESTCFKEAAGQTASGGNEEQTSINMIQQLIEKDVLIYDELCKVKL
ncbi:uncharacterized protein LOC144439152 [Glandiceps talaboti]